MQRIHQELQAHRAPNCSSLAQALEVSTKTVRRDLEYMRDQLGLPIEYDPAQHAYFYNREVHAFPTLQVTEGEVLALFVAQKALAQYSGTPFEDPLRHAFEKIASSMGDVLTVSPDGLAEALSFRHTGDAVADMALFQAVTDAVLQSRELRFTYHKLNATRPEPRHVQPYHLACIDHGWYLFAHDLDRQAIRCFALTRLKTLLELGAPFEKPADFSLKEHLMSSFGVFTGEGDFSVRIAFDAFAARLVRERHWHSSQSLRELPDGSLELALRLASLEEIERWTLSWGSHAKVLAPAQLKQRVKRALDKMQASYAEPPAWFAEVREAASTLPQDQVLRLVVALDQPRHDPNQLHFRFRERSRLAAG
ncbi:MAG: helix-turn-helix transcriptional regulator [Verrucomicrobiota bacterium]